MPNPHDTPRALGELLDDHSLSLEDLARACAKAPDWVTERVSEGLLQGQEAAGTWRFTSTTVIRARRIARLESTFDADPQLAALTTDLMEEVAELRLRMRQMEAALKAR
ncbi:MerR family transcriptional regulator [Diaphorobacter sp. HDW4A]|uniref:chaperone modulator CbpM n=1 Tax=Diaphorobacter sp. HDW4A TaxID=2714924 RepID=UPI001409285C|nr:chaperone modulator CbpM [Diaphorobacter sp. HDW4A]QIL81711.1 MerR family transcriptional regulator [Diaphorobacter sp. HDW4A]